MMTSDGRVVDGSWDLTINVTDLAVEKTLRVKGDLHIGGVMLKLVEALDISIDWSDHGLWWPERNMWLSRTRSTLDQFGVQADAHLCFTPMHKNMRILMPDLQIIDMRVNYSINVFSAVIHLCKELGIRKPEELSLARKLDREDLRKNRGSAFGAQRRQNRPSPSAVGMHSPSYNHLTPTFTDGNQYGTLSGSPLMSRTPTLTPTGTLLRTPGTPGSPYNFNSPSSPYAFNGTLSPGSINSLAFEGAMESTLANSPITPTKEALLLLYKPRNYIEKARINAGWLDSSRTLMEQGIRDNDIVLLRFKFYNFYDLNPKYDAIRINQIFEQAKWDIISEETDCTEEEMMMFAALQLQINLQTHVPQPDLDNSNQNGEDDIDAALTDLQVSLEGSSISSPLDITHIPELSDYLRFFKPRKFTFKSYKRFYFTFKDTVLSMYKSKDETNETPMMNVSLRGCEVNPDVNISANKFTIRLFVPSPEGLSEVCMRCDSESQYARWMAACRLASKGKTMADSSYESEVQSILAFLSMQRPAPAAINANQLDIQPEDFVPPRFLKKLKSRQIATRILEAHANVRDMTLMEAKMNYIKAWQALPEYGITYFISKFKNQKKEELLGVAYNRLIRMDLTTGDSLKTWRYSGMKAWHVNWETKQVIVEFEEETIAFSCLTADCKVVHEFLGGYIFLSMRSQDKNQALNEELFHKLTGGWL